MIADLFGSIFIIFSVPFAIFWLVVSKSSKLVIITVAASFMWLLSAFLTSVVWIAIPPLKDDLWFTILVSIPLQEVMRYLWWKILHKAEKGLSTLSPDGKVTITHEKLALASGVGFGLMYGVIMSCNVLDIMSGPGMLPAPGCSDYNFFLITSIIVGCNVISHIFWGVIAANAWEQRQLGSGTIQKVDWQVLFVVAAHYGASFVTLDSENSSCVSVVVPVAVITALSGVIAWFVSKAKLKI